MNHTHYYIPYKRVKKLVLSKCKCGVSKTEVIAHYTDAAGKDMDRLIKELNGD